MNANMVAWQLAWLIKSCKVNEGVITPNICAKKIEALEKAIKCVELMPKLVDALDMMLVAYRHDYVIGESNLTNFRELVNKIKGEE
jgi:hypothetical protein